MVILPSIYLNAQSVGLVLSGGGAKGAIHLGVIKALEENGIPIDYITGTSIGAVVGGMYASGYTEDEMLRLILSKEFEYWQSGMVQKEYQYYFQKPEATPKFANFTIQLTDTVEVVNSLMPTSLIDPIQMNQAFIQLFAQSNQNCHGDFDQLMVPFRCIGSDVFHKKGIKFREGDLGDAIRISMTFPFVFAPLRKDGVPLYDGGIYDNFPVDAMVEDFDPDFILGINLQDDPIDPRKANIYQQLSTMIMEPSDKRIDPDKGHSIHFYLKDVGLLDFPKAKEVMQQGYDSTMAIMPMLKERIKRRMMPDEYDDRREQYKASFAPLTFRKVTVTGGTTAQNEYIQRQFERQIDDDGMTFNEFKSIYFQVLSDSKVQEINVNTTYDPLINGFVLQLKATVNDQLNIGFGGNISSANANQLFLSLGYQSLQDFPIRANLNANLGNAYTGIQFIGRIDFPGDVPKYLMLDAITSKHNYFQEETLFYQDALPSFITSNEISAKMKLGLPFMGSSKAEIAIGCAKIRDKYYPTNSDITTNVLPDRSVYQMISGSLRLKQNTLNSHHYATQGIHNELLAQVAKSWEQFDPFDVKLEKANTDQQSWIQIAARTINYFDLHEHFTLGMRADGVISTKNLYSNYTSTIIQAPAFCPTPHSSITLHEKFRANQYLAAGVMPIYKINKILQLRSEFYGFLPAFTIDRKGYNDVAYGERFNRINLMAEFSAVATLPFMDVAIYANSYEFPMREWNFGLNIGFLIFPPKFLE